MVQRETRGRSAGPPWLRCKAQRMPGRRTEGFGGEVRGWVRMQRCETAAVYVVKGVPFV